MHGILCLYAPKQAGFKRISWGWSQIVREVDITGEIS